MRISTYGERAASIGFLALFPMMYGYHFLVGAKIIPLFLGGWWGVTTVAIAIAIAPAVVFESTLNRNFKGHLAFVALSSIVLAYAVFYRAFGNEWEASNAALINSGAILAAWSALYGIGYFWNPSKSFLNVLTIAWAAMCAVAVLLMDTQTVSFVAALRFGTSDIADYQWWATPMAITGIAVLAYGGEKTQITVVAFTLVTLFLLSSRSEFYGFIAIAGLWTARAIWRRMIVSVIGAAALTFLLFAGALNAAHIQHAVSSLPFAPVLSHLISIDLKPTPYVGESAQGNVRQSEVFNVEKSESVSLRLEFLKDGLSDIAASPFLGVYAGELKNGGRPGSYIHNGLEVWRQYGLIAFGLFIWLCLRSSCVSLSRWWLGDQNKGAFVAYVAVFAVGLSVVTKTVGWPLPALAWGLVAGLSRAKRRD